VFCTVFQLAFTRLNSRCSFLWDPFSAILCYLAPNTGEHARP